MGEREREAGGDLELSEDGFGEVFALLGHPVVHDYPPQILPEGVFVLRPSQEATTYKVLKTLTLRSEHSLSSENDTYRTVRAIFWPCLSGEVFGLLDHTVVHDYPPQVLQEAKGYEVFHETTGYELLKEGVRLMHPSDALQEGVGFALTSFQVFPLRSRSDLAGGGWVE